MYLRFIARQHTYILRVADVVRWREMPPSLLLRREGKGNGKGNGKGEAAFVRPYYSLPTNQLQLSLYAIPMFHCLLEYS